MNSGKKIGKIGREKESLSQLMDFTIVGGSLKRSIIIPMVFLVLLCLPASAIEDNFNDNSRGPLWQLYEEDPDNCWVEETNQRLELRANAGVSDFVAGYVSNRWRLDTGDDFSLKVDFHYSLESWADGWVFFCLLPSLTDPRSKHVAIDAGCDDYTRYFWYEMVDVSYMEEDGVPRTSDYGTLYISYNSAADELYLSYTGYGSANAWITVPGLLKGRWTGDPVYVGIGGGSEYLSVGSGKAYLDNFILESGTVILDCDFCGPNFGPPDGYVDVWDLMQFADHWHTSPGDNWDPKFDLTGPGFGDPEGYVDVWDLMVFADYWHEGEPP